MIDFSENYLPKHQNGVFTLPIRVYHNDIDASRVVYHANYLGFMENTRIEWLRYLGIDLKLLERQMRMGFVVQELNVKYYKPAVLDDLLAVSVEIKELGRCSLKLMQKIICKETLCIATLSIACISFAKFRPAAIPEDFRTKFQSELDARNLQIIATGNITIKTKAYLESRQHGV